MIRRAALLTVLVAAVPLIVAAPYASQSGASESGAAQSGGPRSAVGAAAGTAARAVTFQDISHQAGLDFIHVNGASPDKHFEETMGSGGVFLDADQDGWLDIFLVDGGSKADPAIHRTARHRLYRNRRNGTFEDVTTAAGGLRRAAGDGAYGMGACAGDYDNDGRTDVYVTSAGPDTLYRNLPDGTFADVTARAGVSSPLWGTSCAFVDIDLDGDLDLFVTNYVDMGMQGNRFCGNASPRLRAYCHPLSFPPSPNVLYRNEGGGVFTDVTVSAGIAGIAGIAGRAGTHRGNGLGVAIADYDDDRWPDVFVANDGLPNFLFHNDGKGTFTETGLVAGVAVAADGSARAGMGTAFGDYDNDGRLDLVVTNHETEMHSLFRSDGGGLFSDATAPSGIGRATLPYVGFGVVFADYDNDGDLDLAIANGHVIDNIARFRAGATHAQPRLLLQNANGRLRDVSKESGPGFATAGVGRALAAGDIDNDGDLDLLVTNNGGRAELLQNDGGNRRHALLVRLVGTASNRDAIGARLRVTAGGVTRTREVTSGSSYLAQNDLRLHVGLGDATRVERLEVRWPSGRMETLTDLAADQILTVREGAGVVASATFEVGSSK